MEHNQPFCGNLTRTTASFCEHARREARCGHAWGFRSRAGNGTPKQRWRANLPACGAVCAERRFGRKRTAAQRNKREQPMTRTVMGDLRLFEAIRKSCWNKRRGCRAPRLDSQRTATPTAPKFSTCWYCGVKKQAFFRQRSRVREKNRNYRTFKRGCTIKTV